MCVLFCSTLQHALATVNVNRKYENINRMTIAMLIYEIKRKKCVRCFLCKDNIITSELLRN